jgi:hypothetical protein
MSSVNRSVFRPGTFFTCTPLHTEGQVSISTTREYVILDLTSEDESGEWVEGIEDSLSAIVGVRSELATGDLRPLHSLSLTAFRMLQSHVCRLTGRARVQRRTKVT